MLRPRLGAPRRRVHRAPSCLPVKNHVHPPRGKKRGAGEPAEAMAQVCPGGTRPFYFTKTRVPPEPRKMENRCPRSSPRVGQSVLGGRLTKMLHHSRAELVAIQPPPSKKFALHRREAKVGNTHRLWGGAFPALQQPHPKGQSWGLITNPPRAYPSLFAREGVSNPKMGPQPVGGPGNEAADRAPKRGPPRGAPGVTCSFPPGPQQLKRRRNGPQRPCAHQTKRELEARKGRRPGTLQPPKYHPMDAPQQQPPGQMAQYCSVWALWAHCKPERRKGGALPRGKCATMRDEHPSPLVSN
ncbi:hypothetical protein GWK47_043201 [Chionoecetes opilio]|uniref:Uncharacterized protein n=1 Tax=Chionoecetes opilio TaxID=41210 RepID=A0A8J4Y816_CHIOP|nr:hypothetical protein GWK47_043201 [Chionoecetes opilio]